MSTWRGCSNSGRSNVCHIRRVGASDAFDALVSLAGRKHVEHCRHAEYDRLMERAFRGVSHMDVTVDQPGKKRPATTIDLRRARSGNACWADADDSSGINEYGPMLERSFAIENADVANDESSLRVEWADRQSDQQCRRKSTQ
jgi:hypothetical protein